MSYLNIKVREPLQSSHQYLLKIPGIDDLTCFIDFYFMIPTQISKFSLYLFV